MIREIQEDLERSLNQFLEKNVIIMQDGFLESHYFIQELKYFFKDDILTIADRNSSTYLKMNTNQIFKIENDEEKTKIYLDNDTIILLHIKR